MTGKNSYDRISPRHLAFRPKKYPKHFGAQKSKFPKIFQICPKNDINAHMTKKWYFQPIQCVLWNWFVLPKFFHCYVFCDCPDLSVMFINGKRFSLQRVSLHSDWFSIISLDQSEIIFHSSLLAAFEDFGNHHEYSTCALIKSSETFNDCMTH